MNKNILLLICLNLFIFSRSQTIYKIEMNSIELIEKLENKFIIESKKSKYLNQTDFKIDHLTNKKKAIKTANSSLILNFQHSWYLFYFQNELVFAYNEYGENSRMGSCGDISIYNYYFIKNNKFSTKWHFEEPFVCYQHGMLSSYNDLMKFLKIK